MTSPRIYLDHNAAAPLLPEARAAVVATLALTGNPSSVHAHGRALRAIVDEARVKVARLAGAERDQVVFTSSTTEAVTQAVVGGVKALAVDAVVVGGGEHSSVSKAAEASGVPVLTVGLDGDGRIRLDELAALVTAATAETRRVLVATHAVNNETGVVQPVEAIGALVGPTPHVLFIDAAQAFGKLPLDFAASPADMMAVGGHKIGAPAGVGALLVKGHADTVRLIPGGGQELGRRGGTEPVALIAGFGAAAEAYPACYRADVVSALRTRLEAELHAAAPEAVIFGAAAARVGNTVNFAVPGLSNAAVMMGLDLAGVSISAGSACSSGKIGTSHVLLAMGVDPELAGCAVRASLGWTTTEAEVAAFATAFGQVLARHRGQRNRAA